MITVQGSSQLVAASGGEPANITLDWAANDFVGAVTASGGNVSLADANTLSLAKTQAASDLTVTSNGALNLGTATVGGNLVANSGNGDITQDGPVSVVGTSTLVSGTGSIDLTNSGNHFGGAINSSGAIVRVVNATSNSVAQPYEQLQAGNVSLVAALMTSPEPGARAVQLALSSAGQGIGHSMENSAPLSNAFERTEGGVNVAQLQEVSAAAVGVIEVSVNQHTMTSGAFEFELPNQAAQVLQNRRDEATATLVDGTPLPPWLNFDATTLSFSARGVPAGALPIQIQVQAGSFSVLIEISATNGASSAAASMRTT
jgi:hypothetical protein